MVSVKINQSTSGNDPAKETTFTLAHLSDPHMSCPLGIRIRELLNKRLYGYLRWRLHRSTEHLDSVLAALQKDLRQTLPDHIAVTGDLAHLSLPAEFKKAENWLRSLGSPTDVTVIPGNHDAYIKTDWNQTFVCWTDYMLSDDNRHSGDTIAGFDDIFPTLRIRGCTALIGVCTAQPTAPYLAVGSIGAKQLEKLKIILDRTGRQRLFRVLLIHHPPTSGTVSRRRRLTDASALRMLLANHGAELILHGHAHYTTQSYLKTPHGHVPVMGAPSASALGRTLQRRARYYIYRISPNTSDWDVNLLVRVYSPDKNRFVREYEQQFQRSH